MLIDASNTDVFFSVLVGVNFLGFHLSDVKIIVDGEPVSMKPESNSLLTEYCIIISKPNIEKLGLVFLFFGIFLIIVNLFPG